MRSRDCSPPGVHSEAHFLVFVPMVHVGGVRVGKQTAPNAGALKRRAGWARWPAEPASWIATLTVRPLPRSLAAVMMMPVMTIVPMMAMVAIVAVVRLLDDARIAAMETGIGHRH